LMSFVVDITQLEDGFTKLDTRVVGDDHSRRSRARGRTCLGYEVYRRYTRELASALARFDPLSTAVLVERGQSRPLPRGCGWASASGQ
jgi:hypothetical protein